MNYINLQKSLLFLILKLITINRLFPLYIQKTRKNNNMVSTMTTRPLHCFINGEKMNIYYVDFLCVHKDKRKQGIAPEIIYSHYVNQSK